MKFIIYDYEVFFKDCLLGCYILEAGKPKQLYQTWDLNEIKQFYKENINSMWVGFNNFNYDDLITECIVRDGDPYKKSKELINSQYKPRLTIPLYSFDLLSPFLTPFSLKHTELLTGKSIDTTEVDFNLQRKLTKEERELTESYNKSDLDMTLYNFLKFYDIFKLRLDIINEFKLDLMTNLRVTGTKLAANVLGAKRDDSLVYKKVERKLPDCLRLENEELKNYFLSGQSDDNKLQIQIGNADITIGDGGAHSAMKKYYAPKAIYADVDGYYNNIMIIFDLFSRAIPEKGKELYKYMFKEQIRLKKINPTKRKVYKTVLLSVFGATKAKGTDFYDPEVFSIITNYGEMFICDLSEKLADLCIFLQHNTDGIIIEPKNWDDYDKIISIIEVFENRTCFHLKKEIVYDVYQRDVNNYCVRHEDGEIEVHGELFKGFDISDKAYANASFFNYKEPPIIAQGIVNALMNDKSPEETVEECKSDFKLFQYACKKKSFDSLTYDMKSLDGNETTSMEISGGLCRCFAWNDKNYIGMVNKHKKKANKESIAKVSNLPDSVFIYNKDLSTKQAKDEIMKNIDYDYYVYRIYERIGEII